MSRPAPDALEPYREAIRALGMKVTPYRMGLQMGQAHQESVDAWRAQPMASRPTNRPAAPECPYPARNTRICWKAGFDRMVRR